MNQLSSRSSLSLATQMWLPVWLLVSVIAVVATGSLLRTKGQIAETNGLLERHQAKQEIIAGLPELAELHLAHASATATPLQQAVAQRLERHLADLAKLAETPEDRKAVEAVRPLLAAQVANPSAATLSSLVPALDQLQKSQRKQGVELREYMASLRLTSTYGTVAIMVLLSLAIAGATFHLVRTIINPVRKLAELADAMGQRDLSQSIDVNRGDELGTLQQALANMHHEMASMVRQAGEGADSVQTAAAEIASGNLDLSQRTETTAAHVQQTNSAISELGVAVRHSAESAATANQLAQQAAQVAQRGGEVVGQVVETMQQINTSSKKISDIIGVIDGIAFQTNILALNAAVEAARAGEQGRGFAVVAGEVRSLASRSAEAAKEIKSLIGASVERVETGTRLVADAGSTMQELVSNVNRVSDVIGEISASTSEQTQHLTGVGQSMVQLDQMAQSNAALVEEGAAAAESLKDQAVKLHELVSKYKVSGSSTSSSYASAAPKAAPRAAPAVSAAKPAASKPSPAPMASRAAAPKAPPPPAPAAATSGNDNDWETF